ncbi:MAG: hypothetical protein J7604_24615 [Sporocytophaga sp.]|uniref:hypothetical protein n=1 Tax=Sporocytophaga sp. TaxID=2231183 RepID=UPI001B0D444B|nr:hypothetical protein [Sporocytophaga sp.]MBO9703415.1 hypothetical protein [Sporocytophaga sp.]
MDTRDITLYLRIQSARKKKRLQKEALEKKLIALHKEQNRLRVQIRNLGYEPLIPPVQKGWERTFVLRDDVRRSPRALFYIDLLKKINTVQYSDSKKFLVKRRKRGKKIYVNREQRLREFYEYEWKNSKFSESERFYFTESVLIDRKGEPYKVYTFNEPWRYVLRIVPNMITMLQIKDAILEQRSDEIRNYLISNNLDCKLGRLLGYRQNIWDYSPKTKYVNPLKNKPVNKILDEYYEDKI